MNTMFLGMIGWPEMVAILAVALLLFGARKLPELARGLGQGIKEFRKATREVSDDLQQAIEEEPPPPARKTAPPPDSDTGRSVSQTPDHPTP